MAQTYFGSKISANMLRTPENFLICYNVPVARTGVQKYLGEELGLSGEESKQIIKVYRTEEEVFSPRTIASFEGKPFTDEHPDDWVTPLNFQVYGKGTITNVRRGVGNENDLLLADIVVYSQHQIDEIEKKQKREISCGYECEYVPYADGYKQQNIVGNHVALVSAGRAGNRVAIKDNKNKTNLEQAKGGKGKVSYKIPRRSKVSKYFEAMGFKQFVQDADPQEVSDVMDELAKEKQEEQKSEDETPPKIEAKEQIKEQEEKMDDESLQELKENLSEVKDALYALLKDEQIKEPEDEGMLEDATPEGMEALDEFEEEITKEDKKDKAEDVDEAGEIESVEKPPEAMNKKETDATDALDADDECNQMKDSAVELLKVLKPIIAGLPKGDRKKVSDNLVRVLKNQIKNQEQVTKKSKDTTYSKLLKRQQRDSNYTVDIGAEIAKKYNPHYKEVK